MNDRIANFLTPYRAGAIAAGGSACLLAAAHAFETFGNFEPCKLCLDQREAHWTGLAVVLITLGVHHFWQASRAVIAGFAVAAVIYLFSSGLAAYHAGVEWKFWPGPATCSGSSAPITTGADLFDRLDHAPIVSCSDAAWRLFGVSMAGYNAVFSLALAAITGVAALRLFRGLKATAPAGRSTVS